RSLRSSRRPAPNAPNPRAAPATTNTKLATTLILSHSHASPTARTATTKEVREGRTPLRRKATIKLGRSAVSHDCSSSRARRPGSPHKHPRRARPFGTPRWLASSPLRPPIELWLPDIELPALDLESRRHVQRWPLSPHPGALSPRLIGAGPSMTRRMYEPHRRDCRTGTLLLLPRSSSSKRRPE